MGVMGRVRRHCDAVTAFMFQPKAQDPRHNLLTHHPKELKFKSKCLLLFFARFSCYDIDPILCTNRGLNCILGVLSLIDV